nr:hypothetical protein [Affinibrenneria salicis]
MKKLDTALEPTAVEASATEICNDFKENEIAANKKWAGKYVVLQGKVSIITDADNYITRTPGVHIEFNKKDSAAFSLKPRETERAAELKKGQQIKIKGQIGSYTYLMGCLIHLDNGTIQ